MATPWPRQAPVTLLPEVTKRLADADAHLRRGPKRAAPQAGAGNIGSTNKPRPMRVIN